MTDILNIAVTATGLLVAPKAGYKLQVLDWGISFVSAAVAHYAYLYFGPNATDGSAFAITPDYTGYQFWTPRGILLVGSGLFQDARGSDLLTGDVGQGIGIVFVNGAGVLTVDTGSFLRYREVKV